MVFNMSKSVNLDDEYVELTSQNIQHLKDGPRLTRTVSTCQNHGVKPAERETIYVRVKHASISHRINDRRYEELDIFISPYGFLHPGFTKKK